MSLLLDLLLGASAGSGRRGFRVSLVALGILAAGALLLAWLVGSFL